MEINETATLQGMMDELASQARTLGSILAASADHIYLYDAAGRYLFANLAGADVVEATASHRPYRPAKRKRKYSCGAENICYNLRARCGE